MELHHKVQVLLVLEGVLQVCEPRTLGFRHDVPFLFIKRNLQEVFGNYRKLKQGSSYTVAMAKKARVSP